MHTRVNGARLLFDVEGSRLVPDGPARAMPLLRHFIASASHQDDTR